MVANLCVALLAALVAALAACGRGPTPADGEAGFDGTLAMQLVERQVAFGPRVPNTPAHDEALGWMIEFLRPRADTVLPTAFTHVSTTTGDTLRLTNVLARFRPEVAARILVVAHWDSRPVAELSADSAARHQPVPGANDGASGTAVLLALADALSKNPPPVGVDLLLTDGEDWGYDSLTLGTVIDDMLLGARHFAQTNPDYRPLFGILLDLVGDRDPRFPWEEYSVEYAPEVVRRVWEVAQELGHGGVFVERPGQPITDEHVVLNEAGIRTIDIIDFDYPHWHTVEDTPDKVSPSTLGIVGQVVLEVIRRQVS